MTAEVTSENFWNWYDDDGDGSARGRPTEEARRQTTPIRRAKLPGFAITGAAIRKAPSTSTRELVLDRQGNRCLYCDNEFGATVRRGSLLVTLRLHWDHFVPYAYSYSNGGANWVAACHVCNGIKSCRMFDTVADARHLILARWIEKGYEPQAVLTDEQVASDLCGEINRAAPTPDAAVRYRVYAPVPEGVAEIAERVSRYLERFIVPVAKSQIGSVIRGSDPKIYEALDALVAAGAVAAAVVSGGRIRYASMEPYRAPAHLRPVARVASRSIECPRCAAKPFFRCQGASGGTLLSKDHPERTALAREMAA